MKIFITGASSFTGYWFVRTLAQKGHDVYATFQKKREEYEGVRHERVEKILPFCTPLYNCTFGSDDFLSTLESLDTIDRFCHHAADVNDYKSPTFSVLDAVENNTLNVRGILKILREKNVGKVILTGSLFEQNEGKGSEPLHAFSPYGLSKGITSDIFKFETNVQNIPLAKFVIPTPFGPYEEPRFTSYLMESWLAGKKPTITYPDYVRDYIPVTLLAESYAEFVLNPPKSENEKINPSFFCETNRLFTERVAKGMRPRLNLPCEYTLLEQKSFIEPKTRINTSPLSADHYEWNEAESWDAFADYYQKRSSICKSAS